MKNLIPLSILLCSFITLHAQDPVNITGTCFSGTVSVPFALNNEGKPAYDTNSGNYGGADPAQITVIWTGTRWEIRVGGGTVLYTNNQDTPLPPDDMWSELQVLGTCTSPSTVSLSGGVTTLPVELKAFEAKSINNQVQLNWSTASELNNDYFEIERSIDGMRYTVLGKVTGNGTTSEPQTYAFQDKAPKMGSNYYRLHQVDFDGGSAYSDIVHVKLEPTTLGHSGLIYPNPARDQIFIEEIANMDQISLRSLNGTLIKTFKIKGSENDVARLSLAEIPSGFFILEIELKNGVHIFEKVNKY